MASSFLLTPLSAILFEDKFQFSARQSLPFERHRCVSFPTVDRDGDVCGVKAPDFSIKLYRSSSEPRERKTRASPPPDVKKKIKLPQILPERERSRMDTPKFRTFYRPPGGLEEELRFVKTGKYPPEKYENPRPHDFRPLDEDVPDFITTFDQDPGKTLDTIYNSPPESSVKNRNSKMDTFRAAEPQWDPRLLLPVGPWPPKSASFTRHRRRRGAYSAFLERVEEKLSRSWQKT